MAKLGRPFSPNPRREQFRLRMNADEKQMLKELSEQTHMNQSDILRTAVEMMWKEQKKTI